jgi:hypothetical protein
MDTFWGCRVESASVISLCLFSFDYFSCFLLLLFVYFSIVVSILLWVLFFCICEHDHANLLFNIFFFICFSYLCE